jgi:hypothetical protein
VARAKTYTWLSLDRFAEITGLNPFHFNQITGQGLINYDLSCGKPWFQEDYQWTEQVSRETVAEAIRNAEIKISQYAGFNLIPDWNTKPIRVKTIRLRDDGLVANKWNSRGMQRSVELPKGYYIGGGRRAKSLIQAGVAVVITDPDGDGFSEFCTVTVATTVTDCEIRVYLPGRSGADEYEVRPISVSSIGGGLSSITFKRWQIVDPDKQEGFKPQPLEHTVAGNFETTVDIYRVYNDPSVQATLYWEPDTCNVSFTTQNAMLAARDNKLGIVTYRPATYSAVTGQFTLAELTTARDPDFMDVYFCSGWEWEQATCNQMDPYWEEAIAHFAISEIDRDLASCNNTEWMFKKWRDDLALVNTVRSYNVNPTDLTNPFGTRWGAVDAWKRVKARAL